jgi:hypothetical protein
MNSKFIHDSLDELLEIAAAGSLPNVTEKQREMLEDLYLKRCARLQAWIRSTDKDVDAPDDSRYWSL